MNRRNFIRGGFLASLGMFLPNLKSKEKQNQKTREITFETFEKDNLVPDKKIILEAIKSWDIEKVVMKQDVIDCTRPVAQWWQELRPGRRTITIIEKDKYSKISNKEWWGKDYYKADK